MAIDPMTLLMVVFLAGGGVLVGISVPLIQARVGPNSWYGFRVRRTLEDPNVWYLVNAYTGWRLLSAGVVEIVVATALYFVPDLGVAVYASIVGGVTVAALIVGLVQSFCYLHQVVNDKRATAS